MVVAEVLEESSAASMGVRPGDVLLAVNNQDVSAAPLEAVLDRISSAPGRVLNMRFARPAQRARPDRALAHGGA